MFKTKQLFFVVIIKYLIIIQVFANSKSGHLKQGNFLLMLDFKL